MKLAFTFFLWVLMTSATMQAFAAGQQPVVSNNIVVLQNITSASQCPPNYHGVAYPTNPLGVTPSGSQSGTANQVVQSCSGCYFTPATRTCTCRICYGGYN